MDREWDEAPEKKIEWGDYVETPDGRGRVTELDSKSEYRYLVSFGDGSCSWYIDEELVVIKE